jgi:hypothetical protein
MIIAVSQFVEIYPVYSGRCTGPVLSVFVIKSIFVNNIILIPEIEGTELHGE